MTNASGSSAPQVQHPGHAAPQDQEPAVPEQARIPRTHTSPVIVKLIRELPLFNKLQRNKQIETENQARSLKKLNHALDPVTYTDPGSEQASLITIDSTTKLRLKIPSFAALFKDVMPASLATWLADEELAEREERDKKKRDEASRPLADEVRVAKRRCLDGSNQVTRVIGAPNVIQFPQSLYDTELCVAVPLPFFLNKNLRYITDFAATLPTVKSNPRPGETKGTTIIDVDKLSLILGKELSLSCSEWMEAAYNAFRFQCERDVLGSDGAFASWWAV